MSGIDDRFNSLAAQQQGGESIHDRFNRLAQPPSIGQQAESFLGSVGNAASLHLLPQVTGYVHSGIDAAQDFVGPGRISQGLGALQQFGLRHTGNPEAEQQMQGQGAGAYEQSLRDYHHRLQQQAPTAATAGELVGSVAGAFAGPVSAAGGITGLARNAGIDAAMSGVDMYGQTGDISQVPQAMATGAGLSAGIGGALKGAGAVARGVGSVAQMAGGAARAARPVADLGARGLDLAADMSRRTDPMQVRDRMRQGVNNWFDEMADPAAVERRANEANAAQAGMRQVSLRNKVDQLPGPIQGFQPGAREMLSQQIGKEGRFSPLGEGEGRQVFDLGNDRVLKMARAGQPRQNATELGLYRSLPDASRGRMAAIHAAAPDASWIASERLRPINSLEEADKAFGPGQLEALDESLFNMAPDPRLSPEMRQAFEDLAPLVRDHGAARGEMLDFGNFGVDAQGKLKILDLGELKGGRQPGAPIRDVPGDLTLSEQMPRAIRGEPGVQGFGQDVERLGLLQPTLAKTRRQAQQIMDSAGSMRGDVVRQVDDMPLDASGLAQALNQRADELSRVLNQGGVAGKLRMAANEVSGRADDLTASELWESLRSNRKKVKRNMAADDIDFYKELEKTYDAALDKHVWGYGGDELFQAWKQAGRDYQVALQTEAMTKKLVESGAANRSFGSLTDMLAMVGGMAAGGPLGFASGAAMMGANKVLRANEKPWEAAFYRHVRDANRAGNPLGAQQLQQGRQAALGLTDVASQFPGMMGRVAGAGATALRAAGATADVAGAGLQAAGGAMYGAGRGLGQAAPYAGRVAGLQQEPMQPTGITQQQTPQNYSTFARANAPDGRNVAPGMNLPKQYQGPVYDYLRQQRADNTQAAMVDGVRRAVVSRDLPAGAERLQQAVEEGAPTARVAALIQELQQTNPTFASWLRSKYSE